MTDGNRPLWHRAKDLTGRTFAYLTVLRYNGSGSGKTFWIARCVCGIEIEVQGAALTRKRGPSPKSCGCKTKDILSRRRTTHGLSKHPIHAVWDSMVQRCTNPNHASWHSYGGRGITVCKRWRVFENFLDDMFESYEPGLTLDRTDNARGYSPENCRWVARSVNARNTRSARFIDTPLGRMQVAEAADVSGLRSDTLRWRAENGWPAADMFLPANYANRYSILRTRGRGTGSRSGRTEGR